MQNKITHLIKTARKVHILPISHYFANFRQNNSVLSNSYAKEKKSHI